MEPAGEEGQRSPHYPQGSPMSGARKGWISSFFFPSVVRELSEVGN